MRRKISDWDQRLAYTVLFALAVLLFLASYVDSLDGTSNQGLYVAGFVGLLVVSIGVVSYTMWDRRDQKHHPPALLVHSLLQASIMTPSQIEQPVSRPPAQAAPIPTALPAPPAASTPVPAVVSVDLRGSPVNLARENPVKLPKPKAVPARVPTANLQLDYEAASLAPADAQKKRYEEPIETSPTRVLCNECGEYFVAYLGDARPVVIGCPQCDRRLLLKGTRRHAPHVALRCRHCGEKTNAPTMPEVSAHRCPTCGQRNEVRQLAPVRVVQR